MDCDIDAVAVSGEPAYEVEFSFCTLVTKPQQFREMVSSFRRVGFDESNSEYLYIDNTNGNSDSAYSGLNRLARFARGEYLVFCHQDVVAIDGPDALRTAISDLTERDPLWSIAANAGCNEDSCYFYLNDPNFVSVGSVRRPSAKVMSVDENFIVLKREAQIGFSVDLEGFHLYGTDLAAQAHVRGRTAYVVDFRVEHLSSGNVDSSFYKACIEFEDKYAKAFSNRSVTTTCTSLDLGTTTGPGRRRRIRNLERGVGFERKSAKVLKAIRGWSSEYTVELDGKRFSYPREAPVSTFQSLRKGKYEQERLELIKRHLPNDLPNIVLGASFGVICGLARNSLQTDTRQIVVEKDPALIDLCAQNASLGKDHTNTLVLNCTISYPEAATKEKAPSLVVDGDEDLIKSGAPSRHLYHAGVPAASLGKILQDTSLTGYYSLICNIGGMELDLIDCDRSALSRCRLLIMALHPRYYYQRNELVSTLVKKLEAQGFEIVETLGNNIAAKAP
ncbi:glycosyltransferase family A protein [Ruegeria arenilitoris]|uniref:glycosyltransferase family A protein n=1 Tax=Ruegeria arenilitoris TaxID=1173585 RepID=UPI001C983087|nr:glycosyltransferase family A protein [Ruegeria arenilitoris]MBY6083629.1 glycosyltransferase family 2 protein [Ruegeria arenilitoris]